jgi:membrane dipeptidase
MLGLTWNRSNQFAQGLAEDTGAGISVMGRDLLDLMEHLNIALDVSHMSPASFWSALERFRGPVLASHTNAWGATQHPRNLSDDQLKAIAERGGVVGLCFIPPLAGGDLVTGLVRHADHIRKVIGLRHIALAADFANFLPDLGEPARRSPLDAFDAGPDDEPKDIREPDVTMLPDLHRNFLAGGWSPDDTAAVFGGNALRFLRSLLPPA